MVKAGGARAIREDAFQAKELARQIKVLADRPDGLANAAHAAWNCGRPDAASDLADLVEGSGGADMMDIIRVQAPTARTVGEVVPGTATRRPHREPER
jgi:UDP-N-acetylglucosamine--N-acetylmuramyl-(pentapeptide) pyrophosphoryl-undecaprenol N-acetylglucosamine transferase